MLKVVNYLLLIANNQQVALIAFLDLADAFDTVGLSMLLLRLQSMFVISGVTLSWFGCYLTGRTQSGKIHSLMSKRES